MVGRSASVITRWLLLCALAFAVVVMHHLASTSHESSTEVVAVAERSAGTDHHQDQPPADHDVLHLCLAILIGLVVVGGAAFLARLSRREPGAPAPPGAAPRSPGPPPPLLRGGRATLHAVCVLRL